MRGALQSSKARQVARPRASIKRSERGSLRCRNSASSSNSSSPKTKPNGLSSAPSTQLVPAAGGGKKKRANQENTQAKVSHSLVTLDTLDVAFERVGCGIELALDSPLSPSALGGVGGAFAREPTNKAGGGGGRGRGGPSVLFQRLLNLLSFDFSGMMKMLTKILFGILAAFFLVLS